MPHNDQPDHGAIVTYVDNRADDGPVFRRAVALGTNMDDPQTEDTWIPVMRTDSVVTLVDPATVVDVIPGQRTADLDPAAAQVVDVTRGALDGLTRGLASPAGASAQYTQVLLEDFVSSISPIPSTLDVLVTVDPTGTLAVAVMYLVTASAHLDDGDIDATRTAIEAAHAVLDGMS